MKEEGFIYKIWFNNVIPLFVNSTLNSNSVPLKNLTSFVDNSSFKRDNSDLLNLNLTSLTLTSLILDNLKHLISYFFKFELDETFLLNPTT